MFIFFVRHGQPDYEHDCLTEYGKKQAEALAERFSLLGLDKIYSSTMGRAMETAEYTAKKLGLKVEGVDFAREDLAGKDFGMVMEDGKWHWCFVNQKFISLFNSEKVIKLGDKWYDGPFFAGTNFKSGVLRVKNAVNDFMRELGYRYDEKSKTYTAEKRVYDRVALFSHEGFFMLFASCLLNIPYPIISTMFQRMSTSTITVFRIEDEGKNLIPQIWQYSNDSHLYKAELLADMDRRAF